MMRTCTVLVACALLAVATAAPTGPHTVALRHHAAHPALRAGSANTTIPSSGDIWPVGIYYTTVVVGGMTFPVAIDSGSSSLYIEGQCSTCPHHPPNREYDPSKSPTSAPKAPYVFSATYETCDLKDLSAPCTISGKVYSDQASLGGLGPVTVTVGAITSQTSDFSQFQFISGVMGFADSGANRPDIVMSQLVHQGIVTDNVWALCLAANGKFGNGTLSVGGIDSRLYTGNISYVDDVGRGFYGVDVSGGITVGTSTTPLSGSTNIVILDTGTNISLFPTEIFNSLRQQLEAMCTTTKLPGVCGAPSGGSLFDEKCFPLTAADIEKFPPLHFNLDGVTLTLHAADYLFKGDVLSPSPEDVCLGIRATQQEGLFIVGDALMRNYYLIFDTQNARIGWAAVNKDNCGNVE